MALHQTHTASELRDVMVGVHVVCELRSRQLQQTRYSYLPTYKRFHLFLFQKNTRSLIFDFIDLDVSKTCVIKFYFMKYSIDVTFFKEFRASDKLLHFINSRIDQNFMFCKHKLWCFF